MQNKWNKLISSSIALCPSYQQHPNYIGEFKSLAHWLQYISVGQPMLSECVPGFHLCVKCNIDNLYNRPPVSPVIGNSHLSKGTLLGLTSQSLFMMPAS